MPFHICLSHSTHKVTHGRDFVKSRMEAERSGGKSLEEGDEDLVGGGSRAGHRNGGPYASVSSPVKGMLEGQVASVPPSSVAGGSPRGGSRRGGA